jgi:hypothetical protein
MFECAGCSLLKAEVLPCGVDVLYRGLGINKLIFLFRFLKLYNLTDFSHPNPEPGSGHMRIRSTGGLKTKMIELKSY